MESQACLFHSCDVGLKVIPALSESVSLSHSSYCTESFETHVVQKVGIGSRGVHFLEVVNGLRDQEGSGWNSRSMGYVLQEMLPLGLT